MNMSTISTTRVAFVLLALIPIAAKAQSIRLPLDSAKGLTLHNAIATPVSFKGKKAIKVTLSPEAAERAAAARPPESKKGPQKGGGAGEGPRLDVLAIADGSAFSNGTIEVDLAGEPGPGAGGAARGFVGVAFRVQPDRSTYDCFYLRPTNGRADDQERRNHTAQYIAHPGFPWFKLRQETPSRYESWADIGPAEWIHVRIDVNGARATLTVNGMAQPTLIVNDVKSGEGARGPVALWLEGSTVAHYADLKITNR
jgi:hypothetical protein